MEYLKNAEPTAAVIHYAIHNEPHKNLRPKVPLEKLTTEKTTESHSKAPEKIRKNKGKSKSSKKANSIPPKIHMTKEKDPRQWKQLKLQFKGESLPGHSPFMLLICRQC
jgi:hypothetical protein